MTKYLAEFIGTFLLACAVSVSIAGKFPVVTPAVAAITLAVCVYTLGAISGTHINPAITIGVWSLGKMGIAEAAGYIAAQFTGGVVAMLVSGALAPRPALTAADSAMVCAGEALGTFVLAFGVASVVHGKAPGTAAGLTIGGSLLIGILLAAGAGTNGVLNPAVAVGIGSISLCYLLAPLVGALAAMQLYKVVQRGS